MMNYNYQNVMDSPVPNIGVEVLQPTPFKREVQSLRDGAKNVANTVKRKWKEFNDWLMDYIPESVLVDPSSIIEKFKERIKELYKRVPDFTPVQRSTAAKGYFKTFTIEARGNYDPPSFLDVVERNVIRLIENNLNRGIKVKLVLHCDMEKRNPATSEVITESPHFRSKLKVIVEKDIISGDYKEMREEILENIAKFQREGSNWNFKRIIFLDIHVNKYEPLSGSSYIPLPKVLQLKRAIINVKNTKDNECFKWAVTSAIYPSKENAERLSKYVENSMKFDWSGINFPASLGDVDKFERQNPSVSINVFGYEREVYPLRISKRANEETVNLLLISEGENQHYC